MARNLSRDAEDGDRERVINIDFIRKVYEGGKVTIPKELRELHTIEDGAYLRLKIVAVFPKSRRAAKAVKAAKDPQEDANDA